MEISDLNLIEDRRELVGIVDVCHGVGTSDDRREPMFLILVVFPFYKEVDVISRLYFIVVFSNTTFKVALEAFLSVFEL